MEFWSKGLGRRSLKIACGTESVELASEQVLLHGTVGPPLSWKYTITMEQEDWEAFFQIAFHPVILKHLIHPKRWKTLLRAGVQLSLFFAQYVWRLLLRPFGGREPLREAVQVVSLPPGSKGA